MIEELFSLGARHAQAPGHVDDAQDAPVLLGELVEPLLGHGLLEALGPPPGEGEPPEASDISKKRALLAEQVAYYDAQIETARQHLLNREQLGLEPSQVRAYQRVKARLESA